MKANRYRGSGRPGAAIKVITIQTKKAAEFCGDKIHKTFRIANSYAFDRHQNIMQSVFEGKYNGTDMHYRKLAAYYKNR